MKDLVDIFEQNERRFFGHGEDKQGKCSFCKGTFHADDLTPVGEQVIRGKYIRNAKSCSECEPFVEE